MPLPGGSHKSGVCRKNAARVCRAGRPGRSFTPKSCVHAKFSWLWLTRQVSATNGRLFQPIQEGVGCGFVGRAVSPSPKQTLRKLNPSVRICVRISDARSGRTDSPASSRAAFTKLNCLASRKVNIEKGIGLCELNKPKQSPPREPPPNRCRERSRNSTRRGEARGPSDLSRQSPISDAGFLVLRRFQNRSKMQDVLVVLP